MGCNIEEIIASLLEENDEDFVQTRMINFLKTLLKKETTIAQLLLDSSGITSIKRLFWNTLDETDSHVVKNSNKFLRFFLIFKSTLKMC